MKLGLIAGNGRFPFLVLDAARSLGHDVTVDRASRTKRSKELEEAAAREPPARRVHWIVARPSRHVPDDPQGRRLSTRR